MVKPSVDYQCDFPNSFDIIFTSSHWSSFEKCVSLFEKVFLSSLKAKKIEPGYPKKQCSLIVMNTFKGQDIAEIKESQNYV